MSSSRTEWWDWLERRSATLFLVGGVLVGLDATVAAVPVITDARYPMLRRVFSAGFVLAFIGLVGLYPKLAHRNPWLAGAGAISAGLGAVGFSINVIVNLGQLAGVVAEETPGWLKIHALLILIGFVVGYLSFGVVGLGSDRYSQSLGLILLVPAILYVILLIVEVAIGISRWVFLITAVDAVAILAIGYLLRSENALIGQPSTTQETG